MVATKGLLSWLLALWFLLATGPWPALPCPRGLAPGELLDPGGLGAPLGLLLGGEPTWDELSKLCWVGPNIFTADF